MIMFRKILTFSFVTLFVTFSNVSFAKTMKYQDLKNLAIEMITPSYWNPGNENFRKDIVNLDKDIDKRFNALSKEEQDIVMNLVRNNWKEFSFLSYLRSANGGRCGYQTFPDVATIKDPVTKGNANIVYGNFSSNISNNPNGEFPCDTQIWYNTSKPYVWWMTWRARRVLNLYPHINKRTDFGKDSLIIWWTKSLPFYWTAWFDMHNEFVIWD